MGEGIDLTTPESELAASHLLIDLEWNIVHHASCLATHSLAVLNEILRTEGLSVHDQSPDGCMIIHLTCTW